MKAKVNLPKFGIVAGEDVPEDADEKYVTAYLRRGWIEGKKDVPATEKPAAGVAKKKGRHKFAGKGKD